MGIGLGTSYGGELVLVVCVRLSDLHAQFDVGHRHDSDNS
jgi:hypothetical protein